MTALRTPREAHHFIDHYDGELVIRKSGIFADGKKIAYYESQKQS